MLNSLQAGRAFAALAVMFYHLSILLAETRYLGHAFWREYTALGYLGVDFFFALSGFIITAAHYLDIGRPAQLGDYLVKRFVRIYPLYWLVTGALLTGAWLTNGKSRLPAVWPDMVSMMSLVHFNGFSPPLSPAWTLYHEIFFYALMGVAIWRKTFGLVLIAAWGAVLAGFAIAGRPDGLGAFANMVIAPTNFAFFGGVGACWIYKSSTRRAAAACLLAGSVLLVCLLAFVDAARVVSPFKIGLAVAFMCLLGGVAGLERSGVKMKFPVLVGIGNASFMLYLTHENLQSSLLAMVFRIMPALAETHAAILFVTVSALCVVFAAVAYRWIEKPLIRALRSMLLARTAGYPARRAAWCQSREKAAIPPPMPAKSAAPGLRPP